MPPRRLLAQARSLKKLTLRHRPLHGASHCQVSRFREGFDWPVAQVRARIGRANLGSDRLVADGWS